MGLGILDEEGAAGPAGPGAVVGSLFLILKAAILKGIGNKGSAWNLRDVLFGLALGLNPGML